MPPATLDDIATLITKQNDLLEKQNDLVNKLIRQVRYADRFFPLSADWTWFQITLNQIPGVTTVPHTLAANSELVVVTDDILERKGGSKKGWLHSLNLSVSSGNLRVELKYSDAKGRSNNIADELTDFRNANFDQRAVMPGDPVVVDRQTDGLSTPPEWTARIGPSWNLPFNTPFTWKMVNRTATDIVVYGHDIYFLLLNE